MRLVLYILLLLLNIGQSRAYAQVNLVLNPSFEELISCPSDIIYLDSVKYWNSIILNQNDPCYGIATNTCCSYITNCGTIHINFGPNSQYQLPKTGATMITHHTYTDPMSSSIANYRQYAMGTLSSVLINGKSYCGKVYINLSNVSPFKTNQFGMYFDDGSVDGTQTTCTTVLNKITQINNNPAIIMSDTLGWMKIEGAFIANGTENHVTLGSFKTDAQTIAIATNYSTSIVLSAYNIDDVSLVPIEITAFASNDTTICLGDSAKLGRPSEVGLECNWFMLGNGTAFSNNSRLNFKPTATGTYILVQSMDNCQMSYDTVVVTVTNCSAGLHPVPQQQSVVFIRPNPTTNVLNISSELTFTKLEVLTLTGQVLILNELEQTKNVTLKTETLQSGVYFIKLYYPNGTMVIDKFIKVE